jgi:hypothetical protein
MKQELLKKDFWAGVLLIVTGGMAIFIAQDYRFGSVLRMGPGFFPTILGALLIVLGICIMLAGLKSSEKIQGHLSMRAFVLLPLSLVLFGILMEKAGFIPALIVLTLVSAASGREFKVVEVLLLTAVLAVVMTALFIWGLELPYPLIKGF